MSLLRRAAIGSTREDAAPTIVDKVLRSPARALDPVTRERMERRMAYDISALSTYSPSSLRAQGSLAVSPGSDVYEREADRFADGTMRKPTPTGAPEAPTRPPYDFSRVRVHTDAAAAESANAVSALAYTVGEHIVFGAGQYSPNTGSGQRLLTHELTHVLQQGAERQRVSNSYSLPAGKPDRLLGRAPEQECHGGKSFRREYGKSPSLTRARGPVLQRMARGRGDPPWRNYGLVEVPATERSRVDAAIGRIRTVVDDPRSYDDCHRFFAERCPGGSPTSMRTTFSNAVLWKMTQPSGRELARGSVNGTVIAYSQRGYNQGEHALAQTLVHEMMHNCGITGGDEHHLADVAGLYCMGSRNILSLGLGAALVGPGSASAVELISYRRILAGWASGRIQLTAGGDVNLTGLVMEGVQGARGEEPLAGEFASAMVGVRGRTNLLWGGERFGGLTGNIETGVGVGRFRVRAPRPGERPTSVEGDLVLQVGLGAEFYLPIGAEALPMSVEAAYRFAQPLNDEARRINSFLLTVGTSF